MTLPTNIDASYADTGDPSRKIHQQHHDTLHSAFNDPGTNWPAGNAAYLSVGTTNIDAANHGDDLAAAIAALPSGGGRVWANKPSYTLSAGLSTSVPNLEIVGAGSPGQDNSVGDGATQITVPAGAVGFTFNPAATGTMFQGPTLRRLHFRDVSGTALGGVLIKRTNNFMLDQVTTSDFVAGYGFKSDGTGNVNQYAELRKFIASNCKTGIQTVLTVLLDIWGGTIIGPGPGVAGSRGITTDTGSDTLRVWGMNAQACEVPFDIQAHGTEMHGARAENWSTAAGKAAVLISNASKCAVFGGSFNNTENGSAGVGIYVDNTASDTLLLPTNIEAVTTLITDNGALTLILADGTNKALFAPSGAAGRVVKTTHNTGNVTLSSTSYTAIDTGMDATLPAKVGDWLEISLSGRWNSDAVQGMLDVYTIVSGSQVHGVSGLGGTGNGVLAWFGTPSVDQGIAGSYLYQVQSGDVSAGNVVLRLYGRVSSGTKILWGDAGDPLQLMARNLG